MNNATDRVQRVQFLLDGEQIGETLTIDPYPTTLTFEVPLPACSGGRLTLEMFLPDAERSIDESQEVLGWNEYHSCNIRDAGFYEK